MASNNKTKRKVTILPKLDPRWEMYLVMSKPETPEGLNLHKCFDVTWVKDLGKTSQIFSLRKRRNPPVIY